MAALRRTRPVAFVRYGIRRAGTAVGANLVGRLLRTQSCCRSRRDFRLRPFDPAYESGRRPLVVPTDCKENCDVTKKVQARLRAIFILSFRLNKCENREMNREVSVGLMTG